MRKHYPNTSDVEMAEILGLKNKKNVKYLADRLKLTKSPEYIREMKVVSMFMARSKQRRTGGIERIRERMKTQKYKLKYTLTEEQERYLRENYKKTPLWKMAEYLGVSVTALRSLARRYDLTRKVAGRSKDESTIRLEELIKTNTMNGEELMEALARVAGVTKEDITGDCRKIPLPLIRMLLATHMMAWGMNEAQVGVILGRNRATVRYYRYQLKKIIDSPSEIEKRVIDAYMNMTNGRSRDCKE